MLFKCWVFFHRWTPWGFHIPARRAPQKSGKPPSRYLIWRKCERCGKTQERESKFVL